MINSGFGKHYSTMYTGSLIGRGALSFAVMGFVISNSVPGTDIKIVDGVEQRTLTGYVELNPKLLSKIFGEEEEEVRRVIEFLCSPDPESRTPDEEGRRLIKLGSFLYKVVNFQKYRGGRNLERRREQNREAQRKFRKKHAKKTEPCDNKTGERGLKDVTDYTDNGTPMNPAF